MQFLVAVLHRCFFFFSLNANELILGDCLVFVILVISKKLCQAVVLVFLEGGESGQPEHVCRLHQACSSMLLVRF